MKKFYSLALCIAVAASSFATDIPVLPSTGLTPAPIRESRLVPRQLSDVKTPTNVTPAKTPAKAPAKVAKDFSTVQGLCGIYEYSYTDYFDNLPYTAQVTISAVEGQENTVQIDGLYNTYSVKATLDATAGTLTIARQNVSSSVQAFGATISGTTASFLPSFVGTLDAAAGTVTFPANQYFCIYPGDGFYAINGNNVFTALDEDNLISVISDQCTPDNKFDIHITPGKNITTVMFGIFSGLYEASADNLSYVAQNGFIAGIKDLIWQPKEASPGLYTVIVVGTDANNNILNGDACYLYVNDLSNEGWEAVEGKATYGEDYIYSIYGAASDEYEVAIEKNTAIPGYYRLVNPYSAPWPYAVMNRHVSGDPSAEHNHYLYIHAEDPAKCYIGESCLGLDISDDLGMLVATSYVQVYKNNNKPESTYANKYGTLDTETRTITFPLKALLMQGLNDKEGSLYYANSNNKFKVVLPESLAGVNEIMADDNADAPVEYFNLQGQRIDNPVPGQLLIRRQGAKAEKILVK